MKNNKVIVLGILLITVLSFSGCSIRKVDEEIENKLPKAEEQEEIKTIDTDSDGLLDHEEVDLGTDKNNPDTDNDGLNDFDEIKEWDTNPSNPDTDGDGYSDGEEVEGGYDPLGTGQLDSDNDGLGDADEKNIGTNPEEFDTDGDGLSDKEEVNAGTNPLVAE